MIFSIISSTILILFLAKNYNYLGNKFGLIDKPKKNKVHNTDVALLGGPVIFLIIIFFIFSSLQEFNLYDFQFYYFTAFFLLGLIDDKINLNSYLKILFVLLFSITLIKFDESFLIHKIYFEIFNNEYYFGKLKIAITLFCILLLYIAINMSDGINCLLMCFSLFAILIIKFLIFNHSINLLDISFLLSLFFLIYFNYKNKIFLGNSGASLLAGYFIYNLINVNYYNQIDVFEVISIFLIMGIDMVRLVSSRLIEGKNPFDRDLNHLHHLLLKKFSLISTIIIYLLLSFSPILIATFLETLTLYFILIPAIIYFFIVKKLI